MKTSCILWYGGFSNKTKKTAYERQLQEWDEPDEPSCFFLEARLMANTRTRRRSSCGRILVSVGKPRGVLHPASNRSVANTSASSALTAGKLAPSRWSQ